MGFRHFKSFCHLRGHEEEANRVQEEPGIGYAKNNYAVFANLPVALYRNRIQSYEDIERTRQTGVYRHGDAAFADYLISLGFPTGLEEGLMLRCRFPATMVSKRERCKI